VALETRRYMEALASHAASSGHFTGGELGDIGSTPDNTGLTFVIWPGPGNPIPGRSGLNATSVAINFMLRIFRSVNSDPLGEIDPEMIDATDALLNAYTGDFTLDGLVAEIDLLGQYGTSLSWDSGYIEMDSSTRFRIVDITIPLIINDVWTQEA
jgi:hypothetical protein